MAEIPNRIEALLEEGEFLGRLARALVRDENLADDLVQETWLAALRRPPVGDARSWFATVARNLARGGSRADANRAQRERSVARSERIPSPEEIQRREALRGLVVEKVLGLPAIYRDVVLLRFFENWKPRRIARELGCPVETVNTRLKRALEHLREDLDRENGGHRATWAVGLIQAGRLTPLSSAPLAKGALLLSTTTKIVTAILLVAGVAATASFLLRQPEAARNPLASGDRSPTSVPGGSIALSPPDPRGPRSLTSAPPRGRLDKADHTLSAHDALVCLLDLEKASQDDPLIAYLCAHDAGFGSALATRLTSLPRLDSTDLGILQAIARCPNDSVEMVHGILEWARNPEDDLVGNQVMEALLARDSEIGRAAAVQYAETQYAQYVANKPKANQEQRQELMRLIGCLSRSRVVESVPLLLRIADDVEYAERMDEAEVERMTPEERAAASRVHLRNELAESAIVALSKLDDQDANDALVRMVSNHSDSTKQEMAIDAVVNASRGDSGEGLAEQLKPWVLRTLGVPAGSTEPSERCAALRLAGRYGDEALPFLMPDAKARSEEDQRTAGARFEGLAVFAARTRNEEAMPALGSIVTGNRLPFGDDDHLAEGQACALNALGGLHDATIDDSIEKHIIGADPFSQERLLDTLPKEFWQARPRLLEGMAAQLAQQDRPNMNVVHRVCSYAADSTSDSGPALEVLHASSNKHVSDVAHLFVDQRAIRVSLECNDPTEIVRLARMYRSCAWEVRLAIDAAFRQLGQAERVPIEIVRVLGEDISIPLDVRCLLFWGVIERTGSDADECILQAAPKLLSEVRSPAQCASVCSLLLAFSDSRSDQRAKLGMALKAGDPGRAKTICTTGKCSEDVLDGLGLD